MTTKTKRPAVYQQNVTLTVSVLVTGTEDQFEIPTEELRDKIERHVRWLLPDRVDYAVTDLYAGRGPSGSQYLNPDRADGPEYDELPASIKVSIDRLKDYR